MSFNKTYMYETNNKEFDQFLSELTEGTMVELNWAEDKTYPEHIDFKLMIITKINKNKEQYWNVLEWFSIREQKYYTEHIDSLLMWFENGRLKIV